MSETTTERAPPGQRYIPRFIIYAEFGIPRVDVSGYRLLVEGMVRNRLALSYEELRSLIDTEYVSDFHCVTGWSVKGVRWRGVRLSRVIEMAQPLDNARYLYIVSLDGYTTIVSIDDARDERALLALEINGRPLTPEQGFPVRLFIPHLYGWKSAKWLHKILFIERYIDGYWEARGYHERGDVWREERFKEGVSRHLGRRVAGIEGRGST